jgi:hypothetical protein
VGFVFAAKSRLKRVLALNLKPFRGFVCGKVFVLARIIQLFNSLRQRKTNAELKVCWLFRSKRGQCECRYV